MLILKTAGIAPKALSPSLISKKSSSPTVSRAGILPEKERLYTINVPGTNASAFLNIMMPCTVGWHFDPAIGIELSKEAVETNFWPLFEVEKGVYKINYKPKERSPIADWMKKQGRFKHLFKPGNEHILETSQQYVDSEWEKLLKLEESSAG